MKGHTMRMLFALILALLGAPALGQTYPSPTYTVVTVQGAVVVPTNTPGDTNYTISQLSGTVATTALSAPRVWSLPPVASLPANTPLIISDSAGVVTDVNTLTITPSPGNTINGSSAPVVFSTPYASVTLVGDNVSRWTVISSTPNTGGGGGGVSGCAGFTGASILTAPFSNGSLTASLLIVTGTAGKNIHICAVKIGPIGGTAVNVALVAGATTTTPCDTGTVGLLGGATAATGAQLPANGGGLAYGDGQGIIAQTTTLTQNVCLLTSAPVQVGGVLTYVVY